MNAPTKPFRSFLRTLLCGGACVFATLTTLHAGSATWNVNPATSDWNTAANWTPQTVPNGLADVATFDLSNNAAVSLSASVQASLVFNSGASAYTITIPTTEVLTINSPGITNNSGILQEFLADTGSGAGALIHFNAGSAGNLTHFDILGGSIPTSKVEFFSFSTAGSATIDLEGSSVRNTDGGIMNFNDFSSAASSNIIAHAGIGAQGGISTVSFFDSSTAGSATITVEGGAARNAIGAGLFFYDTSKAGTSTITVNGGQTAGALHSVLSFVGSSTADHALITANSGVDEGGEIDFENNGGNGGTAQIQLLGKGSLDISGTGNFSPSINIGSLSGNGGLVFLGAKALSVGSNSLDTVFSGILQDGGRGGGTGGTLTKVGDGALTLRGASTYTGLTTVSAGTLVAANKTGSATGTAAVNVNAGRIGGNGTIAGSLTLGTGAGSGSKLVPRLVSKPTIVFTVGSSLTFNSDATYSDTFSSVQNTTDSVTANGVTINGARATFKDRQPATLASGTVFTVINNTAATPIVGTFSNLADGATMTIGSNTYQANYEGGDGNDLTLTVVQ